MFGNLTYVIWLGLFIGLPLLALLLTSRRALWLRRAALVWALAGALVGGWAWDALIVRIGGWYYDPNNILNIWLVGLPIEEWLWIVGVTLMFGGLTIALEERMPGRHGDTETRRRGDREISLNDQEMSPHQRR